MQCIVLYICQIPLSTLVHLLSFEDESEALEFCEYYGFNILDGEAILDRAEYIEPETAWPARRSRSLIESKLMLSVGEVCGLPITVKAILRYRVMPEKQTFKNEMFGYILD